MTGEGGGADGVELGGGGDAGSTFNVSGYLREHPQVQALIKRVKVQDLSVKPWKNGIFIAAVALSGALNGYVVQIYIKPTEEKYDDDEFEWAFLGASLFYNWSLMTFFGHESIEKPMRFIADLFSEEARAEVLDELRSPGNWGREVLEYALAGIASIMMADVGEQVGFDSFLQKMAIGSGFALVSKAGGAKELVSDALAPIAGLFADRAVLLQCDNRLRRWYIQWKERETFVDGLVARVRAQQTWIQAHRGRLTEDHRQLARQMVSTKLSFADKRFYLLKALFDLPAEPVSTSSSVARAAKKAGGAVVTASALVVTLASQVGLYRNATKYGGFVGSITIAVNGFMSLLMAKGLGGLVASLGVAPQPLANCARVIGFAIFSAIDFSGGLLTAGTTAEEIGEYYADKVSAAVLEFLNDCAYAGSSFFNGYGIIGAVAAMFVAYHFYKTANVDADNDHLEALLIANLERLVATLSDSDRQVILTALQQLHEGGHINLNDEKLKAVFDKLELSNALSGDQKVQALAGTAEGFSRSLPRHHSYQVGLRWCLFVGRDLVLYGGIAGLRLIADAAGSDEQGWGDTAAKYVLPGALVALHSTASRVVSAARERQVAGGGAGLLRDGRPSPPVGEDAISVSAPTTQQSGVLGCCGQFFKSLGAGVATVAAGVVAEEATNYVLTTLFSVADSSGALSVGAGVAAAVVTAANLT